MVFSYRRKTATALFSLVVASQLLSSSTAAGAADLKVTAPSKGITVIAGRTFTVEWTGTGKGSSIGIDLYHCGEDCDDADDCGEWVTALCPYGTTGCLDNEGDYDIIMPEPPHKTQRNYKVQVFDLVSGQSGCSHAFSLVPETEVPTRDDPDGPFLSVVSPMENDGAVAGETYTVEFVYDNGVGSSVDRFKMDLYKADGSGDCGSWVTTVCDKPTIGCKDSTGDYDVVLPADTTPGWYRIRVGRFEDDSVYGCSGRFTIAAAGTISPYDDDDNDQSFSYDLLLSDDDDGWWKEEDHDGDGGGDGGGEDDDAADRDRDVDDDDDDDDDKREEDLWDWMRTDDDGERDSGYSQSYTFFDQIAEDWQN